MVAKVCTNMFPLSMTTPVGLPIDGKIHTRQKSSPRWRSCRGGSLVAAVPRRMKHSIADAAPQASMRRRLRCGCMAQWGHSSRRLRCLLAGPTDQSEASACESASWSPGSPTTGKREPQSSCGETLLLHRRDLSLVIHI
jgi:hypothetical protein